MTTQEISEQLHKIKGTCDVCNTNPMIGVASTSIPYSCAYCGPCAAAGADPELVFFFWEEEGLSPERHASPDGSVTWHNGGYVSYRDWWIKRHAS